MRKIKTSSSPNSKGVDSADLVIPIASIVGFLAMLEVASGVIQGYYVPIFSDIADHLHIADADLNWFEAAQLLVSALCVPVLSRLGDLFGHKKVLVAATVATAAASWWVAFSGSFTSFLFAWAFQGFYVIWLPLEIAIIHHRTKGSVERTRKAAAVLVFVLEISVIASALAAGELATVLGITGLLSIPAVATSITLVAVIFGVPNVPPQASGRVDWNGFALITLALGLLMSGLVAIRLTGPAAFLPWMLMLLGLVAFWPFARVEQRVENPVVDLRVLSTPGQWQLQVASALFGISALGAQLPLSTFARTDPAETGFGLGASAAQVSYIIGAYIGCWAIGAAFLPLLSRLMGPGWPLVAGAILIAVGYSLFFINHTSVVGVIANMMIAGIGCGVLMAALPAAAASIAPVTHTGFATGMTNGTKTIGGAFGSSIFGLALLGKIGDASGHASLLGYLTVFAICASAGVAAALVLAAMTRRRLLAA